MFADLQTNTFNGWDRGLPGKALRPSFPTVQEVFALYMYGYELGSNSPAPRWGFPGSSSDERPTPPGGTEDGCVVSGRLWLSRVPPSLPCQDTVIADSPLVLASR